jgi:hypothetical protein
MFVRVFTSAAGLVRAVVVAGGPMAGFAGVQTNSHNVEPTLLTIGYEQHREPASLVSRSVGPEWSVSWTCASCRCRVGAASRRQRCPRRSPRRASGTSTSALGNPKPYRDLYKLGEVAAGRHAYTRYLRDGPAWAVDWLGETLTDQRTCVPCVEHDHRVCHREVIVDELRRRMPTLVVEHGRSPPFPRRRCAAGAQRPTAEGDAAVLPPGLAVA